MATRFARLGRFITTPQIHRVSRHVTNVKRFNHLIHNYGGLYHSKSPELLNRLYDIIATKIDILTKNLSYATITHLDNETLNRLDNKLKKLETELFTLKLNSMGDATIQDKTRIKLTQLDTFLSSNLLIPYPSQAEIDTLREDLMITNFQKQVSVLQDEIKIHRMIQDMPNEDYRYGREI